MLKTFYRGLDCLLEAKVFHLGNFIKLFHCIVLKKPYYEREKVNRISIIVILRYPKINGVELQKN